MPHSRASKSGDIQLGLAHSKYSQLRGKGPLGYYAHEQTNAHRAAFEREANARSLASMEASMSSIRKIKGERNKTAVVTAKVKDSAMGLLKRHRKKSRKNRGQRKRAQTRKR